MIDQLTTYMTQVGTEKQKALLGPRDILLTPEFGNMGIADFALMPEGSRSGRRSPTVQRPGSMRSLSRPPPTPTIATAS